MLMSDCRRNETPMVIDSSYRGLPFTASAVILVPAVKKRYKSGSANVPFTSKSVG